MIDYGPVLFSSDLLTVIDGRPDPSFPMKDESHFHAFLKNDYRWASSQIAMQRSATGLERIKSPFRFLVVLGHHFRRSGPELDFYLKYLPVDDDHVNCVMFNNVGRDETHIPLTPWMLLHRAMHIFHTRSSDFDKFKTFNPLPAFLNKLLNLDVPGCSSGWDFDQRVNDLCTTVLTSRAARKKELFSGLDYSAELLAQHFFGGIRFLPASEWKDREPEIEKVPYHRPERYPVRSIYQQFSFQEIDTSLGIMQRSLSSNIDRFIDSVKGQTFSF